MMILGILEKMIGIGLSTDGLVLNLDWCVVLVIGYMQLILIKKAFRKPVQPKTKK